MKKKIKSLFNKFILISTASLLVISPILTNVATAAPIPTNTINDAIKNALTNPLGSSSNNSNGTKSITNNVSNANTNVGSVNTGTSSTLSDMYTTINDMSTVMTNQKSQNQKIDIRSYLNLNHNMLKFKYSFSKEQSTILDTDKKGYVDYFKTMVDKWSSEYTSELTKYEGKMVSSTLSDTFDQADLDAQKNTLFKLLDELTIKTGGDLVDSNGTVVQEGETLTNEELTKWVTDNKDNYKAYVDLYKELATMYEELNIVDTADLMKTEASNYASKFDGLLQATGQSVNWETEDNISKEIVEGDSSTAKLEIFDLTTGKLTKEYRELLAWTSSFTPFETKLGEPYNNSPLSDSAAQLYQKYGTKRTPIFVSQAQRGVISSLKKGANIPVEYMTLGQFIDDFESREMAFFISTDSEQDILNKKSESVGNKNTDSEEKNTETSNTTYLGPIFVSGGSNNFKLNDLNETSLASMSEASKSLTGTGVVKNNNDIVSSIVNMTAGHINMNYSVYSNVIKSKSHEAPGIQTDLARPLYMDFLGNIVTESGYIVVPSAANYTYYLDKYSLPMFNAAIFNNYPNVSIDGSGNVSLSSQDKDKFLLTQSNVKNNWEFTIMNKKGNTPKKKVPVEKPLSKVEATTSEEISDGQPTSTDQEPNDNGTVDDVFVTSKLKTPTIEFMNEITDFYEAGDSFRLVKIIDTEKKRKFYIHNGVNVNYTENGKTNSASTKTIPADGRSVQWKILKQVHNDLFEKDNVLNNQLIYYMATTVTEASDNPQAMLLTNFFYDVTNNLKNHPIVSAFGYIFESLHNTLFGKSQINYLLYTPTLNNFPLFKNFALYVVPITLGITIMTFIVFIVMFALTLFKRIDINIKDVVVSLFVLSLVAIFTLYGSSTALDVAFNTPMRWLVGSKAPMYVIDSIENEYKVKENAFFDIKKTSFDSNPEIVLEKLSANEVAQLRMTQSNINEKPEIMNKLYMAQYDNTPFNLIGEYVYLQGKEIKISVKDLFDTHAIEDKTTFDGNIFMEHNYYGYGEIAYYMPYYNFTESITNTVNGFTEGSKMGYRILPYQKDFYKSTGRVQSYMESIFFIAPDKVDQILEDTKNRYAQNYQELNDLTNQPTDEESSDESLALDDELVEINNETEQAITYIKDVMGGDLEDWLGIKRILYLKEDNAPFPEEAKGTVMSSKWYPSIERIQDTEYMDSRIKKINEKTRNYALKYLLPISSKVSDETLIKSIALYASMEFQKEFSTFGNNLYPKSIEGFTLSNDFQYKLTYIPTEKLFGSNTDKLGLFIAQESGSLGLFFATINELLAGLRMAIRFVACIFVIFTPFILFFIYIIRKSKNTKAIWGLIMTSMVLVLMFIVELVFMNLIYWLTNSTNSTDVGIFSYFLASAVMTAGYIYLAVQLVRDLTNFGYNFYRSSVQSIAQLTTGRYSRNRFETEDELMYADNGYGNFGEYGYNYGMNNDRMMNTGNNSYNPTNARIVSNSYMQGFKSNLPSNNPMNISYRSSSGEYFNIPINDAKKLGSSFITVDRNGNKVRVSALTKDRIFEQQNTDSSRFKSKENEKFIQSFSNADESISKDRLIRFNSSLDSSNPEENLKILDSAIKGFYNSSSNTEKAMLSSTIIDTYKNTPSKMLKENRKNYNKAVRDAEELSNLNRLNQLGLKYPDDSMTDSQLNELKRVIDTSDFDRYFSENVLKTIYKIETKREKKKSELYNMERTQAVDSKFETEKEYNFGTYNPKN